MKKILNQILTIVIFITAPLLTHASVNSKLNPDKQIRALMIGSWVVSPKDKTYQLGGAISTYHEDGTLEYKQYSDTGCTAQLFSLKSKWSIKNEKLVIIVNKDDQSTYGLSPIITDVVQEITIKNVILVNAEGILQHRYKSKKCI